MLHRLSLNSAKIALFASVVFTLPSPAQAGFQWVSPAEAPAPMLQAEPATPMMIPPAPVGRAPVVTAAPIASGAPEIISPVIISGTGPGAEQPVLQPMDGVSASSGDVVKGFAKQVPLAVALRQILPNGYGFSVDPDVDLGVLVSFNGGKPWRDTLRNALDPAGLTLREEGQMVSVGRAEGTPPFTEKKTTTVAARTVKPMLLSDAPVQTETTATTQTTVIDSAPHLLEPPTEAAMAPSSPAMPAAAISETWRAERGDSLRKILESWSHKSHVEINWLAEYDYPLQASVSFTGTFEEAVRNLLTGFETAHPQPVAELHANSEMGQKVLVVETRGNSYSN